MLAIHAGYCEMDIATIHIIILWMDEILHHWKIMGTHNVCWHLPGQSKHSMVVQLQDFATIRSISSQVCNANPGDMSCRCFTTPGLHHELNSPDS